MNTHTQIQQELDIPSTRIERMLGGFAVIVPPDVLEEKRAVTRMFVDAKPILDEDEVKSGLEKVPQIGFVTTIDKFNPDSSLPKNTKIMLIADNGRSTKHADYVRRAMAHEEREGIGIAVDLARNAQHDGKLTAALHDLGARLADHEINVNLASLGITPDDAEEQPEDAAVVKAITTGVNSMIAEGKNPKELAGEIQGAILASEDPWTIPDFRKLVP